MRAGACIGNVGPKRTWSGAEGESPRQLMPYMRTEEPIRAKACGNKLESIWTESRIEGDEPGLVLP